jgi:hypothetical protein
MAKEGPSDVALFRYEIIAPLLSLTGPRGTLTREIQKLAARLHNHPRRGPISVGVGTIEEWLLHYRRDGLSRTHAAAISARVAESTPSSLTPSPS